MNHKEEWVSCDRCGEKIKYLPRYLSFVFDNYPLKADVEDVDVYAQTVGEKIVHEQVGVKIQCITQRKKQTIDLCPKCRKEFAEWMGKGE